MWNKTKTWWNGLQSKTRKWLIAGFVGMMVVSMLSPEPEPTASKPHKAAGPQVVDVRGLTLPAARKQLKLHGNYRADADSVDTAMGIYIEENFIVCKQSKPKGHLVPLKVAKRDCDG